jgi:hypothetical protein
MNLQQNASYVGETNDLTVNTRKNEVNRGEDEFQNGT